MGKLTNKQKSTMFRFVALFALVAVAFAEPEADSQFVYSNVAGVPVHGVYNTYAGHVVSPVVKPVVTYNAAVPVVEPVVPAVPVVKYVNPHHTEGMTKEGVPEKTDSVKIAEKQHEYAHAVAKREADSEADPAVFYNAYGTGYPYVASTYTHYPYTTAVAGYPYNKVVAGVPAYTTTGYTYPVVHSLGKREAEADSDAALYYRTYGSNSGSPSTSSSGTPYTYGASPYRNVYGWY